MRPSGFNTPEVRDLAWVIQSPALLDATYQDPQQPAAQPQWIIDDAWCERQFSKHEHWLRALDSAPQALLDWLTPRHNPRLGYYFESLVEYWLRHDSAISRLVPHLQVKERSTNSRQRTVGEFDFLLVEDAPPRILHWEVAVKFYLQYRHNDGQLLWYGPNPRDRLDIKLQRLFHHQLILSRLASARTALQRLGLNLAVQPRLLLKGYLFYPSGGNWANAKPRVPGLSTAHLRGWWTFLEPFDIPRADSDSRWLYLPRLRWLAAARITPGEESPLMDFHELHSFCFDLLKRHQRPPLLAEMRLKESGFWEEVSRGFVVPRQWPGLHF